MALKHGVARPARFSNTRALVTTTPGRSRSLRAGRPLLLRAAAEEPSAVLPDARVASVSVDVGDRVEQINIQLDRADTTLVQSDIVFPCGFVLENVEDEVRVTEVTEGGAAAAAGCRVGDVVRATTAMAMQMTYPTMNVLFGGVGRPKLAKILVNTTKIPFSKVMDAVRSNSIPARGDGRVILVLERPCSLEAAPAAAGRSGDASQPQQQEQKVRELVPAGVGSGQPPESGAVFDPQIFE